MNSELIVNENWLTKKPSSLALDVTLVMTFILLALSYIFLNNTYDISDLMTASGQAVIRDGEVWRLWTALFAHSDIGHLMNNSLLFVPLAYLLTGYFGPFLFPLLGITMGGVINLIVLNTLPLQTSLIGMSGVVYWMGSVWLTLFLLIDTRKTIRHRFSIALFLTVLLFAPQTYKPETSYLSHLIGFILGIFCALAYYYANKEEFSRAEVLIKSEPDDVQLQEQGNEEPQL